MVALPSRDTNAGVEARVLLAECRGPSSSSYKLATATQCMQMMDRVLWNRLGNPGPFGARGAKTIADVVKAKGQFAGFENFPDFDSSLVTRIQGMIDIANSAKDSRKADFLAHVNAAIAVANQPVIADPSPGKLVAWRTAGASSPGAGFLKHITLGGIDFYYIA